MSVIDLNLGEEVYCCQDSSGGAEPNLLDLVKEQAHPHLLLHWVILQ